VTFLRYLNRIFGMALNAKNEVFACEIVIWHTKIKKDHAAIKAREVSSDW
jgi:hypothetical protein